MYQALAMATVLSYAATPQAAAIAVEAHGSTKPVVERVNIVGRYATVLLDGFIEGGRLREPILVERFAFGWQPLDVLNFR